MNHYVAGIDEAGYGPLLGPLVTSCMMLRVPANTPAEGGQLWSLLADCSRRPVHSASRRRATKRIFVGDSKLVHRPGHPHELERSALALAAWGAGHPIADVRDLVGGLDLNLGPAPWLQPQNDCFPLSQRTELPVAPMSPENPEVHPVMIKSQVVSAAQFNRRLHTGCNKATAAWQSIEQLLRQLWRRANDGSVSVVIDRQGGRTHYAELLEKSFPGGFVWILEEEKKRSAYRIVADGREMEVAFCVQGDRSSWLCAAASLLSKYVRELCMARLNRFFSDHSPQIGPTAGYYTDAKRFLLETAKLRTQLGINDADFVRER